MIQNQETIDNMSAQDFIDADKKDIDNLESGRRYQIKKGFR